MYVNKIKAEQFIDLHLVLFMLPKKSKSNNFYHTFEVLNLFDV